MTNHPAGRESLRQCAFAAPPAHTRRNNGGVTPPSTRHLQKLELRDSPCANPDRKRQTQLSPSLLTVTYDASNQRFAPRMTLHVPDREVASLIEPLANAIYS